MIKLLSGKSQDRLKDLEENSVDTIITDPPYGLSFMGKKWDYDVPSVELWQEALRVLKPGGTLLCFAGTRTQHRMSVNVEDAGFILKDCIMWLYGSGFPKATDISKQLDKGNKRKVIGSSRAGSKARNGHKGDMAIMPFETETVDLDITEPATPEAQLWNGWKSHGLKPAYEPILVAMKPNDGTYAENALKHCVSGLNIDGGRIPIDAEDMNKGRFPANIILDEEAAKQLGEPSRFFYCAKASKKERNAGCEELEEKMVHRMGHGNNEQDEKTQAFITQSRNHHPTVKPIALMEYLCTLTKTPTGGTVLDPFMGSGTTGVAAMNTSRDFIGIEMSEEYMKIAEARLNHAEQNK